MKRIALLLSLAMVLGLGASVLAADITPSGKAWLNYVKLESEEDGTWGNGYRVQLDGKLDENSGFQIRFEGDGLLKRANYWVNFPGVGKLVAGKQNINYSVLDQLTTQPGFADTGIQNVVDGTGFLNNTFTGLSFAPALPEGFKAVGFVNMGVSAVAAKAAQAATPDKILRLVTDCESVDDWPWWNPTWVLDDADIEVDYVEHGSELGPNEVLLEEGSDAVPAVDYVSAADQYTWGVEASYDFGVASIYGGYTKQKLNAKNEEPEGKFAIGASVPVIPDALTLYGEYGKNGDGDENDEKVVGGKLSAGGFDFIAEYALDSEVYMVEAYKTIKNVELNAAYFGNLGADGEESKVVLNTTLYF